MVFVNHSLQTDRTAIEQRLSDQFSNRESLNPASLLAQACCNSLFPFLIPAEELAWLPGRCCSSSRGSPGSCGFMDTWDLCNCQSSAVCTQCCVTKTWGWGKPFSISFWSLLSFWHIITTVKDVSQNEDISVVTIYAPKNVTSTITKWNHMI